MDLIQLFRAVTIGDQTRVIAFMSSKPDIVIDSDADGTTVLHIAARKGDICMVQLLLSYGSSPFARTVDGSTALCDACAFGNVEITKLLLAAGSHVNPTLTLSSPLHEAIIQGSYECSEVLVAHDALLEVSDGHHGTPLHVAVIYGRLEIASLLLRAGANVNASKWHTRPLHLAAQLHDAGLLQLLVAHGAAVDVSDNAGRTAAQLASGTGAVEIANWLNSVAASPRRLIDIARLCVVENRLNRTFLPSCLDQYVSFPEKFGMFRPWS